MGVFMTVTLISFCILVFAFEVASFATYGWFINDKVLNEALDQHVPKGCSLNMFDKEIFDIGDMPFVSSIPISILGGYYINNVGRVRYGTLAHKRIKNIHTELKRQWEAEHPKETEIRKQLKIK